MTDTDSITDNLWWVVPRLLAGVRTPTAGELDDLLAAGVAAIVSVRDDPTNIDLYRERQLPHLWLPVTGGTAPTREQVERFCAFVADCEGAGQGVAVHCSNGRRRTGTLIAAYLIAARQQGCDAALAAVVGANPAADPGEAQRSFLGELANS